MFTYCLGIIVWEIYQCSGSCKCIWPSRSYSCTMRAHQSHSYTPDSMHGAELGWQLQHLAVSPLYNICIFRDHVRRSTSITVRLTYNSIMRFHHIAVACDGQRLFGICHHHCSLHGKHSRSRFCARREDREE